MYEKFCEFYNLKKVSYSNILKENNTITVVQVSDVTDEPLVYVMFCFPVRVLESARTHFFCTAHKGYIMFLHQLLRLFSFCLS